MSEAPPVEHPTPLEVDSCPCVWPDLIVDRSDDAGAPGGDHVILLHPTKAYWALTNESGLRIATLCDGTRTLDDLAGELAAFYELDDAAALRGDVAAFIEQLAEARLLADSSEPALPSTRTAGEPHPYNLAIFLTEQCNLRCKHCFVVEGTMPEDDLTTDEVKRLIDEHAGLHDRVSYTFSGGEVTLHPDWLEIARYACERSDSVSICTNGLLLNEDSARELAALPVTVQVSLDGPDPAIHDFIRGPGAFSRTWAALELLAGVMPERLVVSCTLTKSVADHARRLVEKIDALGGEKSIKGLRFLPLLRQRAAQTHWDAIAPKPEAVREIYRWVYYELLGPDNAAARRGKPSVGAGLPGYVPHIDPESEAWCPLGRMTLVDARGSAYNCPSMNTPEFKTGDIREQSLEEIQRGATNEGLRRRILERRRVVPECAECAWRNFCQGSCSAVSYLETNDWFVTDAFCDLRRELYRRHVLAGGARKSATPDGMDCTD